MWLITGGVSALGILFLLMKLDIRKVLYFDILTDISATVLLMVIFAGTFAGMMAAMFGGAMLSITLYALKKTIGYKKPTLCYERNGLIPTVVRWNVAR